MKNPLNPISDRTLTKINSNNEQSPEFAKQLELNSLDNLIKIIKKYAEETYGSIKWATTADTKGKLTPVEYIYENYINDNFGFLRSYDSFRSIKREIKDEGHWYDNDNTLTQTFSTTKTSTSKTITSSFTWTVTSSAKKINFTIPLTAELMFNYEKTSAKEETITKESTKKVTYPGQKIVISPRSKLKVKINVQQDVQIQYGMAQFLLDLNEKIPCNAFWKDNKVVWWRFPMRQVLWILYQRGYGKWLSEESKNFSVITTDNPIKPTWVSLNEKMTWEYFDDMQDIVFTQTKL